MIRSAALHGSARRRLVLAAARLLLTLRHPALVFRFIRKLGHLPNPAAPRSHHELMLWRKIVDRDPLFVTLTDKLAAKDYIRRICLEMPQAFMPARSPSIPQPAAARGPIRLSWRRSSETGGSTGRTFFADGIAASPASLPAHSLPGACRDA
ncbi:MAG: hypothetical protein E5V62_13845 [Mesorhizobium sp.]|uniref:hypothetical protein n=1 Tax=Mesorhizobium sp. TaxID=1871066 RepID=UPI000FD4DF64|nr:hypothetical protein [Mesorhizobium sp.]RVD68459.1 hypothetical protein EN751_31310 [Mesorhizobium sp. M4A.F.Ca.ET.029.04.2.1]TIW34910.1 MAG: hypothetical protein E5V62_13845 [Mesorhizobium sp.]